MLTVAVSDQSVALSAPVSDSAGLAGTDYRGEQSQRPQRLRGQQSEGEEADAEPADAVGPGGIGEHVTRIDIATGLR